jgi:hypothetical protein
VTLKFRKVLAVFIRLTKPHAKHRFLTSLPEAIDHSGVMLEVML